LNPNGEYDPKKVKLIRELDEETKGKPFVERVS